MEDFEIVIENKLFHDLNPIGFGYSICVPNQHLNLSSREYCLIHYVVSGKGTLKINDTVYHVKKNQIFTIPAHVPNHYQADAEDPWSYIWIGFTGELSQHFSTLAPTMNFHSNLFFEMTHVRKLTSMQEEFLVAKLFDLYRTLFSTETSPNYINAVQNYIDCNYMQPNISIESIASSLNLNRSYLTRLFKRNTNMNIQYYLMKTRMESAMRLLKNGCSVHDTARQVGYVDPFNFSKAFKRFYGTSPSCCKSVSEEEDSDHTKRASEE